VPTAMTVVLLSQNDAADAAPYNALNASLGNRPMSVLTADALAEVVVETAPKMTRRFIHLLFGNNQITPTHDGYGMYIAKSASLRSSDLSRQVGAAIFRRSGGSCDHGM
jgi:hypothetical protein